MSTPTPPTYKTRNWPAYNEALKRRGSLTIWFDPEMSWDGAPTGRRGRQQSYSDAAIQTCLSMKVLFGMALMGAIPRELSPLLAAPWILVGLAVVMALTAMQLWRYRLRSVPGRIGFVLSVLLTAAAATNLLALTG